MMHKKESIQIMMHQNGSIIFTTGRVRPYPRAVSRILEKKTKLVSRRRTQQLSTGDKIVPPTSPGPLVGLRGRGLERGPLQETINGTRDT